MGKDAETKGQTAMSNPRLTVLVVGATGSIGRLVVEEAVSKGRAVRALARDSAGGAARLGGGAPRTWSRPTLTHHTETQPGERLAARLSALEARELCEGH